MKLNWIEDILAVYDTGSLRGAADLRFLTASAFTRRIRALEEAIGSELFDRSNKPLTLRPHVIELIPALRDAAASLRSIQNDLSGVNTAQNRTRLICQHTLSVSWAPKVARVLSLRGESLRVRSGRRDICLFGVLKSDADIALVYEDPEFETGASEELFDRILFGHEKFIPVAALEGNDDLAEAVEERRIPLVTYPRSLFLGEVLERALTQKPLKDLNLVTIAESGLGPAVLGFVREGLGVGWLPSSMIADELKSGEFSMITDLLPSFQLDIVALKSKNDRSKSSKKTWEELADKFERSQAELQG